LWRRFGRHLEHRFDRRLDLVGRNGHVVDLDDDHRSGDGRRRGRSRRFGRRDVIAMLRFAVVSTAK
jgi:hypothetical protein